MTASLSPARTPRRSGSRKAMIRLLSSGGVVALAATLGSLSSRGDAQSGFMGNGVVVDFGGGGVSISGSQTITLDNTTAPVIIDWTPSDVSGSAPIDFLPNGNTVDYSKIGPLGPADFIVLNRIYPRNGASTGPIVYNRIIELNGTINGGTNGSIWFYTPGGFLLGPTAQINVNRLVLSTSQIDTANLFFGPDGTMNFTGPEASAPATTGITISPGAQINAINNANSYVALVAPRVVQGGNVQVNGSVAYVGAQAAQISMNAGLFDITVTTGTDDANGVVHDGTTGGPATTSDLANSVYDHQRIYMAAVPKNTAITMLLGGAVGYTPALSANAESGAVILGAGQDIATSPTNPNSQTFVANTTGTGGADIQISNASFGSNVELVAGRDLILDGTIGFGTPADPGVPTPAFPTTTSLTARRNIVADIGTNEAITAIGDLVLNAGTGLNGGGVTLATSGANSTGFSSFVTRAGSIGVVGGTFTINTAGSGAIDLATPTPTDGGDATGGTVNLSAAGQGLISAPTLLVNASAQGGPGSASGGDATGGSVTLSTAASGVLSFGSTTINVSADADDPSRGTPATGGNATGGSVFFSATGGRQVLGAVTVDAHATGGNSTSGAGGSAGGGSFDLAYSGSVPGSPHQFASLDVDVSTQSGFSGGGAADGATTPGSISIAVSNTDTQLTIDDTAFLTATAHALIGGTAATGNRGGNISLLASNGGSLTISNGVIADASADTETPVAVPGSTAGARGGDISLIARSGTMTLGYLDLTTDAQAGDASGVAGNAQAGTVTLGAETISTEGVLTFGSSGTSTINANAQGASGTVGSNATGGDITLYTIDGQVTALGALAMQGTGQAGYSVNGTGGAGGNGTGGNIIIETRSGQANDGALSFTTVAANSSGSALLIGEGTSYNDGAGGTGQGGTATIRLPVGTLNADLVQLVSQGVGGAAAGRAAGAAYVAGDGIGGTTNLTISGGAATIDTLEMSANGDGGQGASGTATRPVAGIAGEGRGGTVTLGATSGSLTVTTLAMSANGNGAAAIDFNSGNGANGGAGTGGAVTLDLLTGSSATITAGEIILSANGAGGDGRDIASGPTTARQAGAGGSATGGNVTVNLEAGTLNVTTGLTLSAAGSGGDGGRNITASAGGAGGNGTGGTARFNFLSEGHSIAAIALDSTGTGGDGGASTLAAGGAGGIGTGGSSLFKLGQDPTLTDLTIDASGIGGAGGNGTSGGAGGAGQGGTGGSGALLTLTNGALTVTNRTEVNADGTGGQGGAGSAGRGGTGGNGLGGDALVTVTGFNTSLQTNIAAYHADGLGGGAGQSAATSGAAITGADGGTGRGGLATLSVSDGALYQLGGTTQLSADGFGGTGSNGALGSAASANGGAGGEGRGGTTELRVENGGTLTHGFLSAAVLAQRADGRGGIGSAGSGVAGVSGRGGDGVGGTSTGQIEDGNLLLNTWNITARGTGGIGGGSDGGIGAQGGTGSGGSVDLGFFGGTGNIGSLFAATDAAGGVGGDGLGLAGGAGGDASAGSTGMRVSGATNDVSILSATLSASAIGGAAGASQGDGSTGADGGNAESGIVSLALDQANLDVGTSLTLIARALGGNGGAGALGGATGANGGNGGAAQGFIGTLLPNGNVLLDISQGTLTGTADVQITGSSLGGNGGAGAGNGTSGAGGNAIGSSATARVDNGALDGNSLVIDVTGEGGLAGAALAAAGRGARGGNGTGGDAVLFSDFGGITLANGLELLASGTGASSTRGAAGGTGRGGTVDATISGSDAIITANSLKLRADATGGAAGGAAASAGSNGADGGNATGGAVGLALANGATLSVGSNIELGSAATAGAGGAGATGPDGGTGGRGGDATGGNIGLTLSGATLDGASLGNFSLASEAQAGSGGNGGNSTNVTGGNGGSGGNATGGDVVFLAANGDYALSSLSLLSSANGGIGGTGGSGTQIPGNPSATPPVPPTGPFDGFFGGSGDSTGGLVSFGNSDDGTLASGATRSITDVLEMRSVINYSGNPTGGRVDFTDSSTAAGGKVDLATATLAMESRGFDGVNPAGVFLNNGNGALSVASANLYADTGITLALDGPASHLDVAGDLFAFSGGRILFTHANTGPSPLGADFTAGSMNLSTSFGEITADSDVELVTNDSFTASSFAGSINLPTVKAGGDVFLSSTLGGVAITNTLEADGLVTADTGPDGLAIFLRSGGDLAFTSFDAGTDFVLETSGTASFLGAGTADNITISSSDIVIGTNGSLTALGGLSLTNGEAGTLTTIGAGDPTSGYSLSNAEISRLRASDITVQDIAPPSPARLLNPRPTAPDFIVNDVTLTAGSGGNIAPNGRFVLRTQGVMRVQGNVRLTGTGGNGGISLFAGRELELIAGQGSISQRDGANGLAGRMELVSPAVIAASLPTIVSVAAATTITERNTLLGTRDANVAASDEGYFAADTLFFDVGDGLYIQNSGAGTAFDARRGFTARTVSINTAAADAEVIINGRLIDALGGFTFGLPVIGQLDINDANPPLVSGIVAGSTANGCAILDPASCVVREETPDVPTQVERIEGPIELGKPENLMPTVIVEIAQQEEIGFPPLIDEPVTGAGNEDLWESGCSADGEDKCN